MDLHSAQIQGFTAKPFDHLTALPVFLRYLQEAVGKDMVVVSPDTGRVRLASLYARHLDSGVAFIHKRRLPEVHNESAALQVVGDVEGLHAIIVDDMIDTGGTVVAAAHAGWRGLVDGVVEAAVKAMAVETGEILAWLGPAIGPQAFEVGDEVRQIFMAHDPEAELAFITSAKTGKWLADIYLLARQRLARIGVKQVYGGEYCTHADAERFFSYRRDGVTGRMASLVWFEPNAKTEK